MILYITIAFFLSVSFLPIYWAFALSFIFQSIYFQNGTIDISSFGFLVILLRLIISSKIDIFKLFYKYNSIRLFIFILIVTIVWSVSWGANAREFILVNIRMLISMITFAYFLSEKSNLKAWLILCIIPFFIATLHIYLLSIEQHPLYESVLDFGRLRGTTITGEMLNSNQAAYTIFSLYVMIFIFMAFQEQKSKFFLRLVSPLMLFLVFYLSGSLGSRTVIISAIFLFPLFYFDLRVVIISSLLFLFLLNLIDFSTVSLPFVGEAMNDRIRELGTEEISKDSEMSRAVLFSSGLSIFFDNLIFGIGTGNILNTMSLNKYLGEPMMPHNVYLGFAMQFGLIGLFISIWIIYIGIKITRSSLYLGFVYIIVIIIPNLGHDFFQLSITPILILLMEFYSYKISTNKNLQLT